MRTLQPDLPPWVEALVDRAMSKLPADRFQSVTAFATALGARTPTTSIEALERPAGRWIAALLIGAAAIAGVFVLRHRAEITSTSSPSRYDTAGATSFDPTHLARCSTSTRRARTATSARWRTVSPRISSTGSARCKG